MEGRGDGMKQHNLIIGRGPYRVIVRRYGQPCCEYRYSTHEKAEAHAKNGRVRARAVGFTYRVERVKKDRKPRKGTGQ